MINKGKFMSMTKFLFFLMPFIFLWELPATTITLKPDTANDQVMSDRIKTVKIYKEGWQLSYPIITLHASEKLVLSFDELSTSPSDYTFSIIHCNAGWIKDDLDPFEFMDTPGDYRIRHYAYSFSTYVPYVHHEMKLPGDDWDFQKSGNYLITVFDLQGKAVFSKRFMVSENKTVVSAAMKRTLTGDTPPGNQALDITVNTEELNDADLSSPPILSVIQNGNWNEIKMNRQPELSSANSFEYFFDGKNSFPGGNEYRSFDTKSLKYLSPHLQNITFAGNIFNIGLHTDKPRTFNDYFFDNDLNGKFYISMEGDSSSNTDADYVNIYFTLPWAEPVVNGNIYVTGELSDWNFTPQNCMKYNFANRSYELTMLLKQGYYNYMYALVKNGQPADFSFIEGNHFETENDYIIVSYVHDAQKDYDRLAGTQIFNTLVKNGK